MKVIAKNPGEAPVVVETVADANGELPYAFMSKSIGGFFERVVLSHDGTYEKTVSLWVDEEGLIKRLPFNALLTHESGHQTVLVGPILVTATDGPRTVGLSEEQVDKVMKILGGGKVAVR